MKQKKNTNHELNTIPDLDIIDLDLEPVESLLDAPDKEDAFSEEESASEAPISADMEEADAKEAIDRPWDELADSEADLEEPEILEEPGELEEPEMPEAPEILADSNEREDPEELEELEIPEAPDPEEISEPEEIPSESKEAEESEAAFDSGYLSEDDSWVTEDWADEQENASWEEGAEEEDTSPKKSFLSRINWHIMFGLAVLIIIGLVGFRILNYGIRDSLDNYEGNYDAEVLDSIMPLFLPDGAQPPVDDGVTTIVAFGNSPFADDMGSGDSLAHMIEDMTGATVYNCAVAGSYLAADAPTLSDALAPMDAFSFYWLTTAFCLRNNAHVYESIFEALGDNMPANGREAYETLVSLDFSTVDVIVLMYDGSDYLAGHNMYSDENDTDIQQFTGNMTAGIDLIKETYPHIRIIVMSPTYAFAVNEEGQYVSSDQYRYNGQDVLSTYVIKQFQYSYDRSVTFVDNLYGTITEDNASQYLIDNLHLNTEGRKLVAERFVYALNYYNDTQAEE